MVLGFQHIRRFTVVSLTGARCWLNCRFCRARFLHSTLSARKEGLYNTLRRLAQRGVRGVLVSGGFTRDARLPLTFEEVEELRRARRDFNLLVSLHLGLEDRVEVLESLRDAVDIVDFEYTRSPYIALWTRRLSVRDLHRYELALERMLEAGLHVVPHVFLWHPLRLGEELESELRALRDYGFGEATLLVYMGNITPSPERLKQLLERAHKVFDGRLYLGCMRPTVARKHLDPVAVKEGLVERIAAPSPRLAREAEIELYDACCSIPDSQLYRFKMERLTSHLGRAG